MPAAGGAGAAPRGRLQALHREPHQLLDRARRIGRDRGHADAGDELERLLPVGDPRLVQLATQAIGERNHVRGRGIGGEHHERGRRHARNRVFRAHLLGHQLGDARDDELGDVLGGGKRDGFVGVEAQRHHRELAAVAACVREMLAALGDQVMRRMGAGERVVRRRAGDRRLRLLELLARADQAQHVIQAREHFRRVGRLGDEVIRAQVASALLARLLLVARDHHHRQPLDAGIVRFAHAAEQPEAIQLRHVEVGEHHDDGGIGLDRKPGRLAVRRLDDVERRFQDVSEGGADEPRVIDHQHAFLQVGRRRHRLTLPGRRLPGASPWR